MSFFTRIKEVFIQQKNFKRMPESGMITSMSRRGNCHDNAVMESFFGHLKVKLSIHKDNKVSNTTVRKIVLEYIHYYNCVRIQEKLNHLSLKNLGNKWFRCFDWCPVFGVHFKISIFYM